MIPFSPPRIDQKVIDEVVDTLKSGWITTGPKTKEFERRLTAYCGNKATLAVNSNTVGLEVVLRWFGVQEGDEVIVPAYTYCATANVIVHCGAKPVMVDVNADDFDVCLEKGCENVISGEDGRAGEVGKDFDFVGLGSFDRGGIQGAESGMPG